MPIRRLRLLLLLSLLSLVLLTVSCDPAGDGQGVPFSVATEWSEVTVELETLEVFDECDASHAPESTDGEFILVAYTWQTTDTPVARLARAGTSIESGIGTVPIGLETWSRVRTDGWKAVLVTVTLDEWDAGLLAGRTLAGEAMPFMWMEAERCWQPVNGADSGPCLHAGEGYSFDVELSRGGTDVCRATVGVRVDFDLLERLEPGSHLGNGYYAGTLASTFTLRDGGPPHETTCEGEIAGTIDGESGDSLRITGQCFEPGGIPGSPYELVGQFVGRHAFEGELLISILDRELVIPASGARAGDVLSIGLDWEGAYDETTDLVVDGDVMLLRR